MFVGNGVIVDVGVSVGMGIGVGTIVGVTVGSGIGATVGVGVGLEDTFPSASTIHTDDRDGITNRESQCVRPRR